MKLTTQPIDAIIGTMTTDFDKSIFNGGLTEATPDNGMRGNILKAENFRNFHPKDHRTTAYYVVGMPANAVIRNYGPYDHFKFTIPMFLEIHSMRSDTEAEAWKDEAWEILQTRRKDIADLYSDYRHIILETAPLNISAGAKYKWVINFNLEGHVQVYPQTTYDGGAALDGTPMAIIDGGDADG